MSDDGKMKTFGADHHFMERVPVPVGQACLFCEMPILETDTGFTMLHLQEDETKGLLVTSTQFNWKRGAVHRACQLKNIFGPDWKTTLGEP